MASGPAVSVLIRTIGRKEALKDALTSLRHQSLRDFEIVIVEDGPATLAGFLESYRDLSIRYEALGARQGRSTAGNRAMAMATGDYFLFLDEDDELTVKHLQNLSGKARQGHHRIVYSWSQEKRVERDGEGRIVRSKTLTRTRREPFSLLQFIAGNFIPINAVLFQRSLYENAGGFDAGVDYLEDWLLWLRYAAVEPNWVCVPEATAIYNVPISIGSRRREFHRAQDAMQEYFEKIRFTWPLSVLRRDLKRHFGMAVFLRKLYYYFMSFV